MALFRSRAEAKVAEAGTDLRVFGEVENPIALSWENFKALPATEVTLDIHCVTRWSRFGTSFKGVHWRELAKLVNPKPTARFVLAHAERASRPTSHSRRSRMSTRCSPTRPTASR
jgi:DMSO/TMAO reductase YedYZ molybdopterin-dependent catalytic subunit